MAQQHRRRRRKSSDGPKGRARAAREWIAGFGIPSGRGIARLALGTVVCLAAALVLVLHFRQDVVRQGPTPNPFWPADGSARVVESATAALGTKPPDPAAASALARTALSASPLNVAALAVLAGSEKAAAQDEAADATYRLVLERTQRNLDGLLWLAKTSLDHKDDSGLIAATDSFLRITDDSDTGSIESAINTLLSVASDKQAAPLLIERLRPDPAWRRPFLDALAQKGPPGLLPDFMAALTPDATAAGDATSDQAANPDPGPLDPVWRTYFDRLIKSGDGRNAYAIWVGLLPPAQLAGLGYVFNGGFEAPPSNSPFDWTLSPLKGATRAIVADQAAGGSSSLFVNFSGAPADYRQVWQTIVLAPASYSLSGKVRMDRLETSRGLQWRVYCRVGEATTLIGQSPFFSGSGDWSDFQFDFQVPPDKCEAQLLALELPARIPAERAIRGKVWFDDLAIRSGDSDASAAAPSQG
jgi:hypothetical protein